MSWIAIAAAVLPALYLVWWFHSNDVHPEPWHMLLKTFALGIVIVVPVVLLALVLGAPLGGVGDPYLYGLLSAFLTAAIPEELFKFAVVARFAANHHEFDEPMDGVVYGAVASLGFATLENVLYVSDGGLQVALMRAVTAVPAHAGFGALMGYWVGRAKFDPQHSARCMRLALFLPMLLHGLYDAPLLALQDLGEAAPAWLAWASLVIVVGTLVGLLRWTRAAVRELRDEQLARLAGAA